MIAKTKPSGFKNKLFYGDNLDILRNKIAPETVDLCYIDPPFNSKRNYSQIYNNIGTDGDRAQSQAFMDTWEWGDEAIEGFEYITNLTHQAKFTPQTVALIKGLEQVLGRGSLFAYLVYMALRIVEIHRVLKPTGSFYLHCDPTASHYLKLVCDSVFCAGGNSGEFLNEIIWCYNTGGRSKTGFPKKHDIIFWYAKSRNFIFSYDNVSLPRDTSTMHEPVLEDENGKKYQRNFKNGKEYKYYLDKGVLPNDWWTDLQALNPSAKERLGYPTQKPEALLERIINASSNVGDVVLDAYCGCGTTVAVAQRLKRHWIGIDITYQSISLILKRLEDQYKDKEWAKIKDALHLDGVPRDMASALALANRKDDKTRKEFEKWSVLTYSKNLARINDKKGADAGVDGTAYFKTGATEVGKIIFQVKSGGATRSTIATLNSDTQREKADIGILITMDNPTASMLTEVLAAGKYANPLTNQSQNRIQIVTIKELLDGKRLDLPKHNAVSMVKTAEAVGDSDDQIGLVWPDS